MTMISLTVFLGYLPHDRRAASSFLGLKLQEKSDIFSCKSDGWIVTQMIEKSIANRIQGKGKGWVFSPRDFADLGGRSTIDSPLHRLEKKGTLRPVLPAIHHS